MLHSVVRGRIPKLHTMFPLELFQIIVSSDFLIICLFGTVVRPSLSATIREHVRYTQSVVNSVISQTGKLTRVAKNRLLIL